MATITMRRRKPMPKPPDATPPASNYRGRPPGSELLTPSNARLAVRLQADGRSYEQIAQQLNCGKTSVMKLLQIGKQLQGDDKMDPEPQQFTLTRTGLAPLSFQGKLLCDVSSEFLQTKPNKPNPNYWTIQVYETAGKHVVAITYRKHYKGTTVEHHMATATSDVAATIQAYNPLDVLAGYPPGERFANQQRQLEDACRRQFAELTSEALKHFPETI